MAVCLEQLSARGWSGARPTPAGASRWSRAPSRSASPGEGPLADAFEVVRCDLTPVPSPNEAALARTGDTPAFARDYAAFARAFSETSLATGLFTPSGTDPKLAAGTGSTT